MSEPRYHAFLSYSRTDANVAAELQRQLERLGKRRSDLPSVRIFRDTTDLSSTADLIGELRERIDASDQLIVLCSPSAAASEFVSAEVAYWLENKEPPPVLVLAAGELTWVHDRGAFDQAASTALPPVLADAFTVLPTWIELAPDDGALDHRNAGLMDAVYELGAAVLDRDKREVRAEEARLQRRQLWVTRAVALGLSVLAAVAIIAFVLAARSADEASRQRDEAASAALANTAEQTFVADPDAAMLLAVEAHAIAETASSREALWQVAFRGGRLGPTAFADPSEANWFERLAVVSGGDAFIVSGADADLVRASIERDAQVTFERTGHPAADPLLDVTYRPTSPGELLTIDLGGVLDVRDPKTGRITGSHRLTDSLVAAARFSDGGDWLGTVEVVGGSYRAVVYAMDTRAEVSTVALPEEPRELTVGPQGQVAISNQFRIHYWPAGETEHVTWFDNGLPDELAFDPTGRLLAAGGIDGRVKLYDLDGAQQEPQGFSLQAPSFAVTAIPGPGHQGSVAALIPGRGGVAFWSIGGDGVALGWSVDNLIVTDPFELAHGGQAVDAVAIAEQGLVTIGRNGSFQISEAGSGGLIEATTSPVALVVGPHAAIGPSALAVSENGIVQLVEFGERGPELRPSGLVVDGPIAAIARASDGSVVIGTFGGTVEVWDPETLTRQHQIDGAGRVAELVITEGDLLLVGFLGRSEVRRFDMADGMTELEPIRSSSVDQVTLIDDGITALAASSDGEVVLAAFGQQNRFLVQQGEELTEHQLDFRLGSIDLIALSPGGRVAMLFATNGLAYLWNIERSEVVGRPLDVLQGRVLGAAFLDETTLVSGGRSGQVRLWDIGTGLSLGPPVQAHGGDVVGLLIDRESSQAITLAVRSAVQWDLDTSNWSEALCAAAGRSLTEAEWERFLPERPYQPSCG